MSTTVFKDGEYLTLACRMDLSDSKVSKIVELTTDKGYWVRHFRKAKNGETLSFMYSRTIQKLEDMNAEFKFQASVILAFDHRQNELERGKIIQY